MVVFATEEWVKKVIENVNNNEKFKIRAKDWESDFLLIIKADHHIEDDIYFWLDVSNGYVIDGNVLKSKEDVQTDFIFEGTYENWKNLLEGKIDVIKATMAGKFKIKGDMAEIINSVAKVKRLLKIIQKTDTEFY
jgi:putative sterol carrier protein